MLYYSVVFFILALIAAVFGFGGIAHAAAGVAQIIFYIFLVAFAVSLIISIVTGGRTRGPRL